MKKTTKDALTGDMFPDDLLSAEQVQEQLLRPLKHAVWSHQKARLIERYLYFFVLVTRHGAYIDGFAGPQAPDEPETWSAKRVMESRPRYLRKFFLCELNEEKASLLSELWNAQPPRDKQRKESKRTCTVLRGDFNLSIDAILTDGGISEKEATFALLDQRTFECHWSTVVKLARHKKNGNKIELFYFLAVKWFHRALAGTTQDSDKITAWWGNNDWGGLAKLKQADLCERMRARFISELGYRYAIPYPIYEREQAGGSVMYFMIHATDHSAAPGLMWRAYDQAIYPLQKPEQGTLELLSPSDEIFE